MKKLVLITTAAVLLSYAAATQTMQVQAKAKKLSDEISLVVKSVLLALENAEKRVKTREIYRKGLYLAVFNQCLKEIKEINERIVRLKKEKTTPTKVKLLARQKKEAIKQAVMLLNAKETLNLEELTDLSRIKTTLEKIEKLDQEIAQVEQDVIPHVTAVAKLLLSLQQKNEAYTSRTLDPMTSPWSLDDYEDALYKEIMG